MRITSTVALCACLVTFVAAESTAQPVKLARLYQGRDRGPEQSDTFSRKIRIARNGRVSVSNVSGDITVSAATGDEVSIDAIKRWHGRSESRFERTTQTRGDGATVSMWTTPSPSPLEWRSMFIPCPDECGLAA
jgi:hypothetical protein